MAWAVGLGLGVVAGLFFEGRVSPQAAVAGEPASVVVLHWENPFGSIGWIEISVPALLLFSVSSAVLFGLLSALPVGLAFWLRRRSTAKVSPSPCQNDGPRRPS